MRCLVCYQVIDLEGWMESFNIFLQFADQNLKQAMPQQWMYGVNSYYIAWQS